MPDLAQNERQKRTFFTTKPKNRIIMAEERRRQTHREILTKNMENCAHFALIVHFF